MLKVSFLRTFDELVKRFKNKFDEIIEAEGGYDEGENQSI